MVDCRPAAGTPHELAHSAPNGGAPSETHNQAGGGGDMAHGVASPTTVRASTPATTSAVTTYTGMAGMNPPNAGTPSMPVGPSGVGAYPGGVGGGGPGCPPYVCKSVVWCAPQSPPPHAPHAPPPPHGVNPHVYKSVHINGSDLPMNDIATLRYYFNLGVECMWAAYGAPPPPAPHAPHAPHAAHAPHAPPPRHYSPRDLSQDMQQVSLHERAGQGGEHKHKPPPSDKPLQNKGNGQQRPLLGPRFKRGGNQDGNQNSNHNQNKGHNSNMGIKGPNNRRTMHAEPRPPLGYGGGVGAEAECVEPPLLTLPYIHYPPPLYPIQYYPLEADPALMGMMGGMGYMGYEEGVEFGGVQPYYPHPHYPPPHPHQHPHQHPPHPHQHQHQHQQHHIEHK